MANVVDMLITRWGSDYAVSLSSPQLPGIVAAYDTDPTQVEVYEAALTAGMDPEADLYVHLQEIAEVDDETYTIRHRTDANSPRRAHFADHVVGRIMTDPALREISEADKYDDHLVIAALPEDRLSTILSAIEAHQPFVLAAADPESGRVSFVGAVTGDDSDGEGPTLAQLGLTKSATALDLCRAVDAHFGSGTTSEMKGRVHDLIVV